MHKAWQKLHFRELKFFEIIHVSKSSLQTSHPFFFIVSFKRFENDDEPSPLHKHKEIWTTSPTMWLMARKFE
jgi:hypothetical protein